MPRSLLSCVLVALIVLVSSPVANADPSTAELSREVDEARAAERTLRRSLGDAEARLDELEAELAGVVEDFNVARSELAAAVARVEDAQEQVAAATARTASARRAAGRTARALYTSGVAGALPALLAGTGRDLGQRVALVRLAREARLEDAETYAAESARQQASLQLLERAQARASALRDRLDAKRSQVEATVERQQDDVTQQAADVARQASLRAEQERRLAAARAEQVRREAAERAAQQRAARPTPETTPTSRSDPQPARTSGATSRSTATPTSAAGSGAGAVAVRTALAQVGDPYRWGAAGPDAFDCSGLMQYAWKAAGVSLPHSSRMQHGATSRVAVSDLQPGDLVFYYSPISHVAMYIGGGRTVDAPSTGRNVRVTELRRSNLVGAGRPRY